MTTAPSYWRNATARRHPCSAKPPGKGPEHFHSSGCPNKSCSCCGCTFPRWRPCPPSCRWIEPCPGCPCRNRRSRRRKFAHSGIPSPVRETIPLPPRLWRQAANLRGRNSPPPPLRRPAAPPCRSISCGWRRCRGTVRTSGRPRRFAAVSACPQESGGHPAHASGCPISVRIQADRRFHRY